jgi:hypothetical protein
MKTTKQFIILSMVALLIFSGCKKDNTDNTSTLSDDQTAMAIYTAFGTVFSQLHLKSTDENIDQTITSPNGGNVRVTGSASVNQTTGQVNWTITLNWNNYKFVQGSSDFTMNGQMSYSGYIGGTSAESSFSASGFSMSGTVNGVSINSTISYSFDLTMTNGHGTLSGNVDGRPFSYSF